MLTRIFSLLATSFLLLVTLVTPTFAQASPTPLPTTNPSTALGTGYQLPTYIPPTSPLYTDLFVNNMFHTFSCLMVGSSVIGQPCLTYVSGVPVLSQTNFSGGALGASTSLIGMLYKNPPVRTADYLASLGQQFGMVKQAHAQVVGSGANVLKPILALWQVSRNIAYLIMIIIFVVIGLMVMFRNRINPQTVITAQAALPGLVIGLILITFSYFFAALISDTAFVGTNLVGYYFAAAQGKTDDSDRVNLVNKLSKDKASVVSIFGPLTDIIGHNDVSASLDTIENQLPTGTRLKLRTIVGFLVSQFFAPISGGIGTAATALTPWGGVIGVASTLITGLFGFVAPTFTLGFALAFIASLALVYAMIRLILRLVSAYLTIIFLTISAPFQFLAAALPGRQGIATGWILNMLGNILIFPAVLAMFYFVAYLLGPDIVGNNYPLKISNSNQIENSSLVPTAFAKGELSIIGTDVFPLFDGLNLKFVQILLAFGALMALPKIPDVVVGAIGRMGQTGQLLGQEISGGIRSGQGYAGQFQGAVSGTGSSVRQGLFGETQYQFHQGQWIPYYGKPGLFNVLKRRPPKSGPSPVQPGGAQ